MFGQYSRHGRGGEINDRGITRKHGERRVVRTKMVAHIWAQRTQEEARNAKGSFWFRGRTLFSYEEPIACFHVTDMGVIALITSQHFSVTTSSHCSDARAALNGSDCLYFCVPHVRPTCASEHTYNMNSIYSGVRMLGDRFAKPNVTGWDTPENADDRCVKLRECWIEAAADVKDYALAFGVEPVVYAIEEACAGIREAFGKYNDPKRVAARAKAKAQRELKHFKALQQYYGWREGVCARPELEALPKRSEERRALGRVVWEETYNWRHTTVSAEEWLDGASGSFYQESPTLVRRVGDTLETSRGADAPWRQAVMAYAKAIQCRSTGTAWRTNGERITVGHFTVSEISPSGNLKAGCHLISFEEMTRLAVQEVPEIVKAPYPLPVVIKG